MRHVLEQRHLVGAGIDPAGPAGIQIGDRREHVGAVTGDVPSGEGRLDHRAVAAVLVPLAGQDPVTDDGARRLKTESLDRVAGDEDVPDQFRVVQEVDVPQWHPDVGHGLERREQGEEPQRRHLAPGDGTPDVPLPRSGRPLDVRTVLGRGPHPGRPLPGVDDPVQGRLELGLR